MSTPTDSLNDVVLEARGICKSFPGVRALHDVSLRLRRGRLLALLGENGAGKSTLMNVLAGVIAPDRGEILVDGRSVRFDSPRDARRCRIATIFQELSLSPNLTVAENIFLAHEPKTRWGLIDYPRMHEATRALLVRMSLDVAPDAPLNSLRLGQQQVVEIARALSTNARVLIMDEPTSALSHPEIESLLQLIAELKRSGVAIVYITHKFEELADISDDVAIMRDGALVAEATHGSLSHAQIVRLMVGRDAGSIYQRQTRGASEEVLRAQGVCLPHPSRRGDYTVNDVDLHVGRGEVLGIFGLMGAGRTELLETVFGMHAKRARLQLAIENRPMLLASPTDAIAAGLALAPEDRKVDGLVLDMSSRENASLACLHGVRRWGLLNSQREAAHVDHVLERINWRGAALEYPVRNLSGGNQQKIVLAKWLATRPKVLLLDEPTRGIDVNARNEIYALIDELTATGLGVILVSSELPELLALADRIMVMCEGRKTAEFEREAATPELLMHAALPSSAPSCSA
jgi:ribose transport system ATP-binding protein